MADRSDVYGAGFEYPLNINEGTGGVSTVESERSVVSSLIRLFDTAPGEEFMLPEYGCSLKLLAFENDTEAFRAMVITSIREAVTAWEPRVDEILDIQIKQSPDRPNQINIEIFMTLIQNQQVYNFVYPWNIPTA